jgi:hypothetical protein
MKLLLVNLVAVTHPSGHTQYLDAIKIAPNSSRKHRKFKENLRISKRLNLGE